MTIELQPVRLMPGQWTADTKAGYAVITSVTSRPEDEYGNYTDGGDKSKLVHDYELETSFRGDRTRLYYGHADLDAATSHLERLVGEHVPSLEPSRVG